MNSRTLGVLLCSLLLHLAGCASSPGPEKGVIEQQRPNGPFDNLDDAARARLDQWCRLVETGQQWPDRIKLERVNALINQAEFLPDAPQWGVYDYWETPFELLAHNKGDCEDFSIAKYYTLRELGVDDRRMRLTYVKSIKLNQAHMVLSYFPSPGSVPLVLDNLDTDILPATWRDDLLPVYSFNGTGLWIAKNRGNGKLLGSADRLSAWKDLQHRMYGPSQSRTDHRMVDDKLIEYCQYYHARNPAPKGYASP